MPESSEVRDCAVVTACAALVMLGAPLGTSTASPLPNSDRARAMTACTSAQVCISDMHQLCGTTRGRSRAKPPIRYRDSDSLVKCSRPATSVVIIVGSSHNCIISCDRPLALPAAT
jgi:hypothetical protein